MKTRKRKEGFTLIELLITIAILSLILIIVGIVVFKNFNDSKEKATKITESSIKETALAYSLELDNNVIWGDLKDAAGDSDGDFTCTTIGYLIRKGYLKNNMVWANDNSKIDPNTMVKIKRDKYKVSTVSIIKNNDEENLCDRKAIDFNIVVDGPNKELNTGIWYYDNNGEQTKALLSYESKEDKRIKEYEFKIISNAGNSITINNENINSENNSITLSEKLTENIDKFGKSTKVCGKVINIHGVESEEKCTTVNTDFSPPKCTTPEGQSTTWINQNRIITQGCSDSQSGCSDSLGYEEYNDTIESATFKDKIITDKVGNSTTCGTYTVNAYVDKTPPKCETPTNQATTTTWKNENRKITQGCSDSHSGCDSGSLGSVNYTTTTKTATFQNKVIKDKAGNPTTCGEYTVDVYVDKTAPVCTDDGDSTTWTSSNRTISWGCKDEESGCNSSYSGSSKNFTSSTKTSTISSYTIKDKANNSITCTSRTANVYVDKTIPSVPTISLTTSNGYKITANNSSDNYTASGEITYYLTVNGTTYSGTSSAVNTLATSYRTSTSGITISAYAKDKAGNKSSTVSKTLKIQNSQTSTPTSDTIWHCNLNGYESYNYSTAYNRCYVEEQGTYTERYYCDGYRSSKSYCFDSQTVYGYRVVDYVCSNNTWYEDDWYSSDYGCPYGYDKVESDCEYGLKNSYCSQSHGYILYDYELECYNVCESYYDADIYYYCYEDGNEYSSPYRCTYDYYEDPVQKTTYYCPLTGASSTNYSTIYNQCTNYCSSGTYYSSGCYSFN